MDKGEVFSVPSIEDDIADLEEPEEEMDEDEDDVEDMSEKDIGTGFITAKEYQQRVQRPSWLTKPDVLGYLNSFRTLDDNDRARLCRSVATYLQNQINTRNGLYRRRVYTSKGSRTPVGSAEDTMPGAPVKSRKLKRTKSVRDLSTAFGDPE